MFHYRLVAGPLDGQEQALTQECREISAPIIDPNFQCTQEVAELNVAHHGHPFPVGTQFNLYVWNGKVDNGCRIMIHQGVVDGVQEDRSGF